MKEAFSQKINMTQLKRERRNKYAKIPKKSKILFLKKVIEDKEPLKIVILLDYHRPLICIRSTIPLPKP